MMSFRSIKRQLGAALLVTSVAGIHAASAQAGSFGHHTARYRVTVRNVTAANALSPFLAVAYRGASPLFAVGSPASEGLAQLAETGATETLEAELEAKRSVAAVVKAEGSPILAGEARTVELDIDAADVASGAKLSLAAMIGKSNDSFISLPGVELARIPVRARVGYQAVNFDAGSEENTGNVADFGRGGHPTAAAEGLVSYDRGLNLRGDAPQIIAWGPVAAEVVIERLR